MEIAAAVTRTVPDHPQVWLHLSQALQEFKRTQDTRDRHLRVTKRTHGELELPIGAGICMIRVCGHSWRAWPR